MSAMLRQIENLDYFHSISEHRKIRVNQIIAQLSRLRSEYINALRANGLTPEYDPPVIPLDEIREAVHQQSEAKLKIRT